MDCERRLIFLCTLFMVISTGIVTKRSTSCALLPGQRVMMRICVLVKSGNATMGVFRKQMIPTTARIPVMKKMKSLFLSEKEIMFFTKLSISYFEFENRIGEL